MAQTLEQFGQTIKGKYPQYSSLSNIDVAQKVIDKYPQYQSQITEQPQQLEVEQEEGGFFDKPTFSAKKGGVETIPGNIARTFGNIPSSAARLGKAVVAPFNPFDLDSPLNIGSNIVKGGRVLKDIFKLGGGTGEIAGGFAETGKRIGTKALDIGKKIIKEPRETVEKIAKTGIEDPVLIPSLLYGPGKIKGKDIISETANLTRKPTTSLGKKLELSAIKSIEKQKRNLVEELVSPYRSPTVKKAQVSRTTETGIGPFLKTTITPTKIEKASIKEVMKIPGVKKQSYQKNYSVVRDYNIQKAQQLEADIARNDFIISKREVVSSLNKAKQKLSNSPLIVGDAEKTANKLLQGAKDILNRNQGTGSGLLKARKEYDQWVLNQKPKAFDAKSENAFTIANRAIRDSMNDLLEQNAKNIAIKQSLKEQSALYRALENIEIKAAKEADTYFGRLYQRIESTLGTRNKLTQLLSLATGVGLFGAAMIFAKPISITMIGGWVTYKAGKLILKPQIRSILGKILKEEGYKLSPQDRNFIEALLIPNAPIESLLEELQQVE